MPIRKEIIYPVFLECCKFATDTFWKNIFEDLSYGKTPYGTYISKDFLCCSYKEKRFSYKIERKNAKILYNDIYNLLTKKLGILSHKEKIKKRLNFHKTEAQIKEYRQKWTNIRKKNIKDILIEKYVVDSTKKYSLSIKKAQKLLSLIILAIVFKVITTKDIHYSNSRIQHIDGIELSPGNFKITRNIYNTDIGTITEDVSNTKSMKSHWEKYLIMLRKK